MIIIDYNDKHPIYEQVAKRFQTLITSGVLKADEKLPSVRALAVELSINPNTIQRAYSWLEREGYIYTVKGRGNFVKKDDKMWERQKEKELLELDIHVRKCLSQGVEKEELLSHIQQVIGEEKS